MYNINLNSHFLENLYTRKQPFSKNELNVVFFIQLSDDGMKKTQQIGILAKCNQQQQLQIKITHNFFFTSCQLISTVCVDSE